ncbi:AbiTii domain-containing protein [Sphingomonas koreensis]
MAGLVEEIQAQALDPSVKISDLLRRVKLAAVKLKLDAAAEWVDRELRGYSDPEMIPPYRRTRGELRAHTRFHGVLPVTGNSSWIDEVCNTPIGDSIAKIEALAGDGAGELIGKVQGGFETQMNEAHGTPGTEYYVHTPQSVFLDILDQVRNLILDWAIDLEKADIMGEGISFSVEEQKKAAHAAPAINIGTFSGHLHQGNISGHQNRTLVASTDNSTNSLDIDTLFQELIQAIDSNVGNQTHRKELHEIIQKMDATKGTADYVPWFQKLVGYAADYATVLGPFLPALSHLVPG